MLSLDNNSVSRLRRTIFISSLLAGMFYVSNISANSFEGEISQALFTTKLKKNKPTNEVMVLDNTIKELYFYSEVTDMQGKIVLHRWEHSGVKMFEQKFTVKHKTQPLVSKHMLDPNKTGEWMVVVTDESGWPLKAVMFKYVIKGSFAGKGIIPVKP